ncbi:hypothetical protein [Rhizobium sp. BG4]|uniref:hypothetical protein n=1 Tax=Rhizobium sp. BG4 TaxID=2613770 RepID=UPI00193E27A1|nr:hypothetical protein [Rhizobium sp. BG4]QRM44607.1 hypothetical protein F2982_14840 [Rhizobium sp. BG4]
MESAEVHPAILSWLCRRDCERPHLTSALALAMVVMVRNLENPAADPTRAYGVYENVFAFSLNIARQLGQSLDKLGRADFDEAFASMGSDGDIAAALGRQPMIVEHGSAGRIRRELWSAGFREPEVTRHMVKLGVV